MPHQETRATSEFISLFGHDLQRQLFGRNVTAGKFEVLCKFGLCHIDHGVHYGAGTRRSLGHSWPLVTGSHHYFLRITAGRQYTNAANTIKCKTVNEEQPGL